MEASAPQRRGPSASSAIAHPPTAAVTIAPGGFSRCPLLLPLPGTLIRQVADAFLVRQQWRPAAGVIETLDTALARALVLGSEACWITPLGAVMHDLQSGELLRWPVDITPEEPVGLMQRSDAIPSPALRALLGMVRLHAAARRERVG